MGKAQRLIEVDEDTADALEALAASQGMSVAEVLDGFLGRTSPLLTDLEAMRRDGTGLFSPEILAEDEARLAEFQRTGERYSQEEVEAWLKTWGTAGYKPFPFL